jgi:tRNA pseudouridine13 synthase
MGSHWSSLAYVSGKPNVHGIARQRAEDFVVEEQLGFEPQGEGQHAWLWIEKRERNTQDIAYDLARFADIKSQAVGFSGLKDRHAVTRQWFSLDLAGQPEPDWQQLNDSNLVILQATRHGRKLRRGTHKANRFTITLRQLQGDITSLDERLKNIRQTGVPNYFGEQRFGHDEANLEWAQRMFAGERIKNRNKRSLYLSAARSFLFNQLLSRRVEEGSWNRAQEGDVMQLAGSHSIFIPEAVDDTLKQRIIEMDIHPTGPLWGRGELKSGGQVRVIEQQLAEAYPDYCRGLEQAGLKQERRNLRLAVQELNWSFGDDRLTLDFVLETGAFATSVLRECLVLDTSN